MKQKDIKTVNYLSFFKNYHCAFFFGTLFLWCISLNGRSFFRKKDPRTPQIRVQYEGSDDSYTLTDLHLEEYPIFNTYDAAFLHKQRLPHDTIMFRDEDGRIEGDALSTLIEKLVQEVREGKRVYSDFSILAHHNFNHRTQCGLLIVKAKKYPFVVKLFMENPQSFVKPLSKGFEPVFFFYLGGGVNRHLSGFTRIKNLHVIKERLAHSEYWADKIIMPRKWFWTPHNSINLEIIGKNIGPRKHISTKIPAIYAIVADAIDCGEAFSLKNKEQTRTALSLCNYLDLWIDAHIPNFMYEKNTGKIAIIDTEHFPTVVGLQETPEFKSYFDWYMYLIDKCAKSMLFSTKKELLAVQDMPSQTIQFS